MTPMERRASASLASIFALRMLGLFMVLPVFALEARKYPGGDDPALLGLAMGMYGLTQALLQLPFGMASDRFGRKRVIALGLIIFALGSFWAAAADDLTGLLVGRSLQGAGAISAAVTAFLADLTRDSVRTKAMTLLGVSIGLVFALSLVVSPVLVGAIGLTGLFQVTGGLALIGVAVVVWGVPAELAPKVASPRGGFKQVLTHWGLLRLNLGVFVLNAVQLAMWVPVPAMLVQAGLPKADHWQVYLPAVLGSFALMGGVFALERRGQLKKVFLFAIALLALVQVGLFVESLATAHLWPLAALMFAFFCAFNVLEATLPSLASRMAPTEVRGTAIGVFNTLQSLGLFVGGWLGGVLVKGFGSPMLFLGALAVLLLWWVVALFMQMPQPNAPLQPHA